MIVKLICMIFCEYLVVVGDYVFVFICSYLKVVFIFLLFLFYEWGCGLDYVICL